MGDARGSKPKQPPDRPGGAIIESKQKALFAATAAQEKKGQNPTIIDLEGRSDYADYIVIVTTYSERQCQAVAEAVAQSMKADHGLQPVAKEGDGVWVLIDYGDIVVHVFHEDARAYYDLDKLWADAPRVRVPAPEYERARAV
jgi:ribosome-associated protein